MNQGVGYRCSVMGLNGAIGMGRNSVTFQKSLFPISYSPILLSSPLGVVGLKSGGGSPLSLSPPSPRRRLSPVGGIP